jgi:hypothetical protein
VSRRTTLKFWGRALVLTLVCACLWAGFAVAQQGGNGYSGQPPATPFVLDSGAVTLAGNVTGPASNNTVVEIQNVNVSSASVSAGQFLIVSDAGTWTGTTVTGLTCSTTTPGFCYFDGGAFPLAGDVTGEANANTVVKLQNNSLAPGALIASQIMGVTDAGTWAPLNVTGDLSNSATSPGTFTITNVTNTNFWTITPSATVNTTNATPTTIYTTGTLATVTTNDFYVQLGAQNTSGTGDWFFAEYRFAYQRNGAGPVLVGSAPVALNLRGSTTGQTYPGLTEAVSSNTLVLSVTGLAATNITWNVAVSESHVP